MGRAKRGQLPEQKKVEKLSLRIDAPLRKKIEELADSGIFAGEELQVVIRLLLRAGLELEEHMQKVRSDVIQELVQRGAATFRQDMPSPGKTRVRSN
jgi:hypothetical protein